MGSGSTEASDESVDASAASATGPDWGQVALVLLAASILALAAVTIPPLGGVGFQGQGPAQPAGEEGSSGLLQLGSGGDGGSGTGTGDQQLGSGGSGTEGSVGDSEGTGSADGSGESGAGSGGGGEQPGETGDGSGESGVDSGSGSSSGSESGDAGTGQQDGTAGGQPGAGSEPGSADGDGSGEPSQGEFGTGSGDGTAGEPGDRTAEEPGGQSDGTSTDGQESAGDGTTSSDGASGSSGEQTDGTGSGTGEGAGESTGDGGANGDERTTGDGDSSQDGSGNGDTGSGAGSSGSDTPESGNGDDENEDGENAGETGEDESGDDGTSYDISFDEQPTPGSTVEVTVTGDDDPVEGATVYFNDEQVGTTDADGTVTGEVPYTETLEVRADVSPTETETTTARGSASIAGPTLPGLDSSRQFHGTVATPLSVAQSQDSQTGNETGNGAQTTVEMNPETALTIDGDPIVGTNVTVVATVDGNPIQQGTVSVDGEEYGTTDDDGAAVVPVPETPGTATIAAERGEIRAERTVAVEALSLTVDDRFPLPGRSVDARLEYGNESVANATILVDGTATTTTGADGTATVGLPLADEATIAAEYEGARATTTVDGLYRNAALLALAAVVGALLLWRLSARYGVGDRVRSLPSPASLLQRLGDALRTLGRRAVDAVVRLARSLEAFGYWLAGRIRTVARALERAGRWLVALPGELATKGLAALAALHPARLYRFLRDMIRSLLRSSRERVDEVTESVAGTGGAATAGDDEGTDEDVRTLRELWAEFVRLVRPPRLRTKTPGEIGRYAVEKGFPEPPVRTVVDAFRDSEYGKSAPSEDRLERVRSAVGSVTGDNDDDGRDEEPIDKDEPEPDGDRR